LIDHIQVQLQATVENKSPG